MLDKHRKICFQNNGHDLRQTLSYLQTDGANISGLDWEDQQQKVGLRLKKKRTQHVQPSLYQAVFSNLESLGEPSPYPPGISHYNGLTLQLYSQVDASSIPHKLQTCHSTLRKINPCVRAEWQFPGVRQAKCGKWEVKHGSVSCVKGRGSKLCVKLFSDGRHCFRSKKHSFWKLPSTYS